MNQNLPPRLSIFLDWIKQFWTLVAGFIGAVTLVGKFIELWEGNRTTYTWITALLGFLVLLFALLWVGFSQVDSTNKLILPYKNNFFHPRYPSSYKFARFSLLILCIVILAAGYFLYQQSQAPEHKVIVLVTSFEGPDPQNYRVTETIWENLYAALQSYDDVELILLKETSIKSPKEAKIEGDKLNATIVIWGWYAATEESARISAHFDILRQPQMVPESFKNQQTIKDSGITEFQNFVLQDQLSKEMTYLSLATVGFVRYSLQDWRGATSSFKKALAYTSSNKDEQTIQYYIDLAYNIQVTALPPYVEIFIVSVNIPQGEKITESALSTIRIAKGNLVSVMYTLDEKADLLDNRIARFPLDQGVVVTEAMVAEAGTPFSAPGPQWASLIPPGMTRMELDPSLRTVNYKTGVVEIDNLTCHEAASDSSTVVYTLSKNEEVTIINKEEDTFWILVKVDSLNKNCWINNINMKINFIDGVTP